MASTRIGAVWCDASRCIGQSTTLRFGAIVTMAGGKRWIGAGATASEMSSAYPSTPRWTPKIFAKTTRGNSACQFS
jgi:hypothetical protein